MTAAGSRPGSDWDTGWAATAAGPAVETARRAASLVTKRMPNRATTNAYDAFMKGLPRIVMALALATGGSLPAVADGAAPVVIELFTAQGCSSCPPADACCR